jgi:hypothetical protein
MPPSPSQSSTISPPPPAAAPLCRSAPRPAPAARRTHGGASVRFVRNAKPRPMSTAGAARRVRRCTSHTGRVRWQELVRLVRPGGRVLIYAWALDQVGPLRTVTDRGTKLRTKRPLRSAATAAPRSGGCGCGRTCGRGCGRGEAAASHAPSTQQRFRPCRLCSRSGSSRRGPQAGDSRLRFPEPDALVPWTIPGRGGAGRSEAGGAADEPSGAASEGAEDSAEGGAVREMRCSPAATRRGCEV